MPINLHSCCSKALKSLFNLARANGVNGLSETNVRFIKCYEIVSAGKLSQFNTAKEYALFKKKKTCSLNEIIIEIQELIQNGYHISWIDFTLYYEEKDSTIILLHLITDDISIEPKFHVGMVRTLQSEDGKVRLNDYVDLLESTCCFTEND